MSNVAPLDRECRGCLTTFRVKSNNQFYCSPECSRWHRRHVSTAINGRKLCQSCGVEFRLKTRGQLYCRPACGGGKNIRFRKKMADYGAAYYRDAKLRSYYGISAVDFQNMLDAQGGACAICGILRTDQRELCVDHDHATGQVRALLCVNCNRNVAVLEHPTYPVLTAYLEAHGG